MYIDGKLRLKKTQGKPRTKINSYFEYAFAIQVICDERLFVSVPAVQGTAKMTCDCEIHQPIQGLLVYPRSEVLLNIFLLVCKT